MWTWGLAFDHKSLPTSLTIPLFWFNILIIQILSLDALVGLEQEFSYHRGCNLFGHVVIDDFKHFLLTKVWNSLEIPEWWWRISGMSALSEKAASNGTSLISPFNSKVLLYLVFMDLYAKILFGLGFNRPKSAVFANQHGNDPPSLFS